MAKGKQKKKSTVGDKPVENPTNKGGRPTKFKAEYVQKLVDFFSQPPTYEVDVIIKSKNGTETYKTEERPNQLPFLTKFAREIGVDIDTLENWAKPENEDKYPGFFGAYKLAKELQKEFLIQNALRGQYNATAFIFTAKNITTMRDQTQIEHGATDDVLKALSTTSEDRANEIIKKAAESLK